MIRAMVHRLVLNPPTSMEYVRFPFPIGAVLSLQAAGDMGASKDARPEPSADRSFPAGRSRFLGSLGLALAGCAWNRQVHSRELVVLEDAGSCIPQGRTEADGIIVSGQARVRPPLTVTVADCMPVFLFDRRSGAYGLLHSGWKGTGILERAIELLVRDFQCAPEQLEVLLGPAIGSCCYDVDEQRARGFAREWGVDAVRRADGKSYLDLRAANLGILARRGVKRVTVIEDCTSCQHAYSSYRRDGPSGFGHMLAVCWPGERP